MHKVEVVRFIVNKHFCSLEAINYFVTYINYWTKKKNFEFEFSEYKVVTPPVQVNRPLEIYLWDLKESVAPA